MKTGKNHGRGSVGRSIRRQRRWETDLEWKLKTKESHEKSRIKRRLKINNRCIDCNKLITPKSTRCLNCHLKKYRHLKVLRIKA
jgi:hypothetical protein